MLLGDTDTCLKQTLHGALNFNECRPDPPENFLQAMLLLNTIQPKNQEICL